MCRKQERKENISVWTGLRYVPHGSEDALQIFSCRKHLWAKKIFSSKWISICLAWIRCSSACIWGYSLDFVVMHKESWSFGLVEKNYHVNGLSISKHKVNGAFNVAILEIVAASVVTESILTSKEATAVESCHVTWYSKSCTLFTISSCWWWRSCILRDRTAPSSNLQDNHHIVLLGSSWAPYQEVQKKAWKIYWQESWYWTERQKIWSNPECNVTSNEVGGKDCDWSSIISSELLAIRAKVTCNVMPSYGCYICTSSLESQIW